MNERMNQWMNEKPSMDFGSELRLKAGNQVIFQFVANGDDGDRFIKAYRSHMVPTINTKTGQKMNVPRYCPVQSNDEQIHTCAHCDAAEPTGIKERMSIWMYVYNILHTQMPQDKSFPQVNHEGRFYFNEEVNGFRVWHTSAWRESPWSDICKLFELYHGLHNFTAQLAAVGEMMARRYKVYPIPQSAPLSAEIYERAKTECQPLFELVRTQIGSAVAANPTPSLGVPHPSPASMPAVTPFAIPGAPITTLNLGAGSALGPLPIATDVNQALPAEEEDNRRPLRAMF